MYRVRRMEEVLETRALREAQRQITRTATTPGTICALIGESGSGKTVAVFQGLGKVEWEQCVVVRCDIPNKEDLTIGSLMSQVIYEASPMESGGNPKRDIQLRTEQIRRLLGTRVDKGLNTVLVIEEAHALMRHTLRALKRLLELAWGARIGLCSIVLIAQPELRPLLRSVPEIDLRCQKIEMGLMTLKEATELAGMVARGEGKGISEEAAALLGAKARNPLAMANIVSSLCDDAATIGRDGVTVEMVRKTFSIQTLRVLRQHGVSQADLARDLGMSQSAVSEVLSGTYKGAQEKVQAVNRRLEELARENA